MKFIADFHIHSHYSIATSKDLTPENLEKWALLKGIQVVGTGDMIHPSWYEELQQKLIPSDNGLFQLNDVYRSDEVKALYGDRKTVQFILTGEISNIYKKGGKTRKVHNLILTSTFETLGKIQTRLDSLGNIRSDGRPILGLPSRDLLEIVLESGDDAVLVPAHIWTPWFSVLGSKSGYDSIEECFEDLTESVFALETGLSSDPPMNRICSFLDRYTLISNSDAHSPEKLGREANLFDTDVSYPGIMDALKRGHADTFLGTVEFFPEEGKYHLDGHRKCGIRWNPQETEKHRGICPVCEKKVTVGVLNRVIELADRSESNITQDGLTFYSLTSLKSLLSEIIGVGPNSKKVDNYYQSLIKKGGSEFAFLLDLPIDQIKEMGDEILAEGIKRLRNKEVYIEGGFDGEFGRIRVFEPGEISAFPPQISLFGNEKIKTSSRKKRTPLQSNLKKSGKPEDRLIIPVGKEADRNTGSQKKRLNEDQEAAVNHSIGPCLILAGPGTGKTFTLTKRIACLIKNRGADPSEILAVTFTNKAAEEMKNRIQGQLADKNVCRSMTILTFHSLGLEILRKHAHLLNRSTEFALFGEDETGYILKRYLNIEKKDSPKIASEIKNAKNRGVPPEEIRDEGFSQVYREYEAILETENAFDIDDLNLAPVRLFRSYPEVAQLYRNRYKFLCIDEYQDVNLPQYQLIRILAPEADSNIFAIGDPNQAIYSFRGSDVRFIQSFQEDYPPAQIHRLTTSYRCSDTILNASSHVIGDLGGEGLIAGLHEGVSIAVQEFPTAKSEAEYVARTIEKMMGGTRFFSMDSDIADGIGQERNTSFSDFAVLFRLAKMAPDLIKAMNDHGIPYQLVGEKPFFNKEPIASIIDVLRFMMDSENEIFFKRLHDKKIKGITESWRSNLGRQPAQGNVVELINRIVAAHFSDNADRSRQDMERFLSLANQYDRDLSGFISFIQLGAASDTYDPKSEKVTLMTLHASKGLEFPSVFIVGCEDGIIPFSLLQDYKANPEEERRLFYVGMTRTQRFLHLTHARKRPLYGRLHNLPLCPFVGDIQEELLIRERARYYSKDKKAEPKQLSLFDSGSD